jgi:hypothetical protein
MCLESHREHLAYYIKHATVDTPLEEFRELIERYLLVSEAIQQTKREITNVH